MEFSWIGFFGKYDIGQWAWLRTQKVLIVREQKIQKNFRQYRNLKSSA